MPSFPARRRSVSGHIGRVIPGGSLPRAQRVQSETFRIKQLFFGLKGRIGMMLGFIDQRAKKTGRDLSKGVWRLIPVKLIAFYYYWTLAASGRLQRRFKSFWSRRGKWRCFQTCRQPRLGVTQYVYTKPQTLVLGTGSVRLRLPDKIIFSFFLGGRLPTSK